MVTIRKTTILLLISVFLVAVIASSVHAELKAQDLEMKSVGEDDEVKPGEVLSISYLVNNEANIDFEDINVEMWFERGGSKLQDNQEDTLRPTFDLNDIDAGDDKSINYDLTIPWDVDDGERYDIKVKVKGTNSTSNIKITSEYSLGSFKIVKENRELFLNTSFSPAAVTCGDNTVLHIDLRNIGKNDEEAVNLSAVNKVIGINVREVFDMSDSFSDDTTLFSKDYTFAVNKNINPGKYELSVRANFDGGYKEVLGTINLAVDCVPSQTQPAPPATPANNSQTLPANDGNQQPTPALPAAPAAKTSDRTQMIIIIVAGEVAILIIVLLVYLIMRKNKKPQQSPPPMYWLLLIVNLYYFQQTF